MEKRHRQPLTVTLTAYGVFFLGVGYCLAAGLAVWQYSTLKNLPLSVPAWYFPIIGSLWGGLWLALGIGLWLGTGWSRRIALIAIPVQIVVWLADWHFFTRSATALQSFGFEVALRFIAAAIGMAVLFRTGDLEKTGGSR
jgi:hypothetical protein